MTAEKLLETIEIYQNFFVESGFKKAGQLHDELPAFPQVRTAEAPFREEGAIPEELLEAIETYRKFFVESGFKKTEHLHDELLTSDQSGFEHCHGMLDRMVKFVQEGRLEKAFRWLGFIQGFLWSRRVFALAEHNDKAGFEHCHGMLDPMVRFVHEGRLEKTFRWLGFIQGFLWAHRIYTLAEIKDHNRSKGLLDP
ncbi:MAG: hypothetical protein WC250_00645 [Candidatus Paceibacterota bacterium]|jgi:hypothetical protein